jgi:hypothetical protein
VSVPAIVILLELEAPPKVCGAWMRDTDEERLADWLDAHPRYRELIVQALQLERDAQAA